jgi:phosphohistidine phosphatase
LLGILLFTDISWKIIYTRSCGFVTMPGAPGQTNPKLEGVEEVVIDPDGKFKYILCKVHEPDNPGQFKFIVRGTARAEFHSDIYDECDLQLEELGLMCQCVGGGKIIHDAAKKTLEVYGKSQAYGKANHSTAADILKKTYPDYASIIWKDD